MVDDYVRADKSNIFLDHRMKNDITRYSKITKLSYKCKNCGHTIFSPKERTICTHCGYWAYRSDKSEFKYKMLEKMKKSSKF